MARAFLFVLDSFGIGGAADSESFGDAGSDTFGHIAQACEEGRADREGLRQGPIHLPHLMSLGLGHAARLASGFGSGNAGASLAPSAFFGAADEISSGKDTPSGHWEIAGVPVTFEWGYFPLAEPAFPAGLTEAIIARGKVPDILGNCHASGTEILAGLGEEHLRSGKPILYTSADSVLQIAAHETKFGLARLIDLCVLARELVDPLNIGRVIARPFLGATPADFVRTANRRDFAVPPPEPTLLDRLAQEGRRTIGIGKIGDIFAGRGLSEVRKAGGNMALFDAAMAGIDDAGDGDLVFANFVDFDMLFGHRRDVAGYAAALEAFDRRLPELFSRLERGDLLILTADHGCDPTWTGSDHTRERIPILGLAPGFAGGDVGLRASFADIGETVAEHLGLSAGQHGASFLASLSGHA